MKLYYHRFTVEGTGHFPHDMLRYDGCWPSTSEDASKISFYIHLEPDKEAKRKIQLTSVGHKDWKPTLGRWQSFGWQVIEYGNERREVD